MPSKPESQPRLNPFAFPSDTTSRFVLLLVFVAVADIAYWHGIASQLGGTIEEFKDCLDGWPVYRSDIHEPARLAMAMGCAPLLARSEAPVLGFGLILLALATFALYWLHPAWMRKWLGLTTFSDEDLADENLAEITAELRKLGGVAEAAQYPIFSWNPFSGSLPIAFGRSRPYFVALTGGFTKIFDSERAQFRAVVLHELAHIRNGDIAKTYLTIAVCLSFAATALIPYLVVEFFLDHSLWYVLDALARILFFGAISQARPLGPRPMPAHQPGSCLRLTILCEEGAREHVD